MQNLHYVVGNWHAEAVLEELEAGKMMAVISLTNSNGAANAASKHTVVFQHKKGKDARAEIEMLVRGLVRQQYGM